jgi:hypothetical protein
MKRPYQEDSSYSSEDEASFLFKPVQKKIKLTKKTIHDNTPVLTFGTNFNEKTYKLPYDKPKSINLSFENLQTKFDNSKIKLSSIMDIDDNIIEIKKIQKSHESIPRADGFSFKDPNFLKNLPERYNEEWLKNLTNRQHILNKDPSYQFLRLLSGKINTDVKTVINTSDLDDILDYNKRQLRELEKERKRLIVSVEGKHDQIKHLEEILEKDKFEFEDQHENFIKYSNLLNYGNIFIETGKNKDIPEQFYGQGILYLLMIENDFSPIEKIFQVFMIDDDKNVSRTSQVFFNEMDKIEKNTKRIGKEIFPNNKVYDYNHVKDVKFDRKDYDYYHYVLMLIFKYYLFQDYSFDGINLPPKLMVQKRFKYLINISNEINQKDIIDVGRKLNEPLSSNRDKELAKNKYKYLLNKYEFSDSEESSFQELITGNIKLIDLIFTQNNDQYFIIHKELKEIYNLNWDSFYGTQTINLKNFIQLFCPQTRENEKIVQDVSTINKTHQKIYNLILQLTREGAKVYLKNSTDIENQQIYKEIETYTFTYDYIRRKLPNIYDLINRVSFSNEKERESYSGAIVSSFFMYYYFKNIDYPLIDFRNRCDETYDMKIRDSLKVFLSYYNLPKRDTNYVIMPFLVDILTIKFMKELYFISMNQYIYDIVKILYNDKIIQFNEDILKLIEINYNEYKKDEVELSDDETKINASFYKIVNESLKKEAQLTIIDKSFEKYINSLLKQNIGLKKRSIENQGKEYNKDTIIAYSPTQSLNINNKFNDYPVINVHLYYYLYVEYLKSKSNKINKSLKKTQKGITEAKKIISNIAQEKIDMSRIENTLRETYSHPLSWILDPVNSGVFRVIDPVSSAIADALCELKKIDTLKDLTLPVIILTPLEVGLTIQFCVLVSYIYQKQSNRSNQQYYKNLQITGNFNDIVKQVFEIKNHYSFRKPATTSNPSFLGTIITTNKTYQIYDPQFKSKQSNIASFV